MVGVCALCGVTGPVEVADDVIRCIDRDGCGDPGRSDLSVSPVIIALLLACGCPDEQLELAVSWLAGRWVPETPEQVLADIREAVKVVQSMT